ncbi:MAG: transcriptional regulator [Acidobacteria bacterium]|nr:MAG: transcriptional regulator [Acidobacteriota bacterium]
MNFLNQVGAILWKDILTEYRTKDALTSMLIFGLLVILMFHFAFEPDSRETEKFGPGLLWMTFIFAGILGMNRAFATERENDSLQGLMLAPVDWSAIYLGKMLANLVFMLLAESVILFCFALFFNFSLMPRWGWMVTITVLGTLGFASVGTILAAVSMNTRMSDVMLPILLLPIALPVVIGAVESTAAILTDPPGESLTFWIKFLVVFNVIFITLPLLLFDFVLEE